MARVFTAFCVAAGLLLAGCTQQTSTADAGMKSAAEKTVVRHARYTPLTPVTLAAPGYPVAAIGSGVEGSILVCFTVEADGSVSKPYIKAVSSDAVKKYFAKGALASITGWKFHPWRIEGKPVSIDGVCRPLNYANSGVVDQERHIPLTPMTRVVPSYPPSAGARGIQGSVLVCFTVEADGSVSGAHVKSASSEAVKKYLGQAAIKTLSQWKFYPWLFDGKPVATTGVCNPVSYGLR